MSGLSLLSTLASQGLSVQADGSALVLSPKDKLTDVLRAQIRSQKPVLIASLTRLRRYADGEDDWQEIVSHPKQLQAFIYSLVTVESRERGIVPDHYTAKTTCRNCGPVPIWPGCPAKIEACPWCLNGQSVPKTNDEF